MLLCAFGTISRADGTVVFNELMFHPATNEPALEWVELHNQNAIDVDLSGWRISGGIDFTFTDGTVIRGGGYLVVAISPDFLKARAGITNVVGPFAGRLSNNGETLNLRDLNNRLMDSISYGVDGRWPAGPDGSGVSLAKKQPNLASKPADSWTVSRQVNGTPGAPNFPLAAASVTLITTNLTLIPLGASWRYFQSGDPGPGWLDPSFDDNGWAAGPALLGYETNALPFPLLTTLTLGEPTYYFRIAFDMPDNPSDVTLNLRQVVDDGMVAYLNGVEVLRVGIAEGVVTNASLASRGVGDAVMEGPFLISSGSLVFGRNVLAVEVHQASTNSSDVVFGLSLEEKRTLGSVTNAAQDVPLTGATTNLVPLAAEWRFNDAGADLGAAWRKLAYDDSAWASGPALFFAEESSLPGPKNTPLTPGRNTYYFRAVFPFGGDPAMTLLSFRAIQDDGAVIYLNGSEIGRLNMPTGAVNYGTMASVAVPNATWNGPFSVSSTNLVVGQNVLAVELHQTSLATNAGLRIIAASGYAVVWDGSEGDFSTPLRPSLAPTNAALAASGAEVFASSGTNLASRLNDGRYGNDSAWVPDASDTLPGIILRFNKTIPVSSIAWSRDNGDTNDASCGGTCADRALGNYTIQYTLATNPAVSLPTTSNPSNGWTTLATVQYLSAQPGFQPHLRHRFDFARTNGQPILATGMRLRCTATNTLDEIEVNPPALETFDAVFGLELTAADILPPLPALAFNEVSAAGTNDFWIEIVNAGSNAVSLAGLEVLASGSSSYHFAAGSLAPGAILGLTQKQLGFGAADGEKLFLMTPGRYRVVDAVTVSAVPRGRFPDGVGDWLYPSYATPGGSNVVKLRNDIVINEIMFHAPPVDPVPAVTSNCTLVPITGAWRYDDTGTDLGTSWRAPDFNDAAWPSGSGLLAYNVASLSAPSSTTLAAGRTTYYFRTSFDFSGATSNVTFDVRPFVDDGAVFYLNGSEIGRLNMPSGSVSYSTLAASSVGNADYGKTIVVPASSLVQGVNVLAVEVHQAAPPSAPSGIVLSGGGLTLVEEGPFDGTPPMNLARQPGAAPFVIDSLAGFPIHDYLHLTDGVYGNANSWIGNSGSPGYAGVSFGGLHTISGFAFGRDNLGTFADRTFGAYTLQYTRVVSPGTGTTFTGNPDTGWATIGTLNYQSSGAGLFTTPSRRHRFTFTPVEATGIRLLVPVTGIAGGTCIDELEVNPPDNSNDIAFGAVLSLTTTLKPAVPFTKSDEEWLEFYNPGANPVVLTGWRIDGGVDYHFPTGAVLEAGAYLVVASDAAALRAKWPEVAASILGDFGGKLQEGDTVTLKDASGNPVSTARVRGLGWSDGGGSSLELIDPRADPAQAGAWADSIESSQSVWQTVTYRMVAGQKYGPTFWNEFRIGMLDVGEALVDDLSVIRDPDGLREQLIQNGDFEIATGNTHWRMLGDHGGSRIIVDPDKPSNHVLKVSATDPTRTSHNHIESSFTNNTPLVDGQEYEVSFRARWLAGSPQLGTTAYFQKLAHTTLLPVPPRHGTPGSANSRLVANAGPTFSELRHTPITPVPNAAVTVSVRAADPDGVAAASLYYRVNPATAFASVPMALQSDGAWAGSIPGQAAGKIVQFYVSAQDGLGAAAVAPPKGPDSRALFQVADTQGTSLPAHELRLIQLDADRDFMLSPTNVMSQARLGGTVVYDRSEVFYDVMARLHGSAAGRARDGDDYISYDIEFPSDHLFRGVHGSVGIDRSGRAPTVRGQEEIYVLHMFQRAGLPCQHCDLGYFIAPKTSHTGTVILQLGAYNGLFVDEQFNQDGAVFNYDITYEPSTTVDGSYEGLKLPVPLQGHIYTDFADLGNDKEQYRSAFDIRHGAREDYFDGIIRLCQSMGLPQAQFDQQIAAALDVDEALRLTALTILCGIGDIYFSDTASLPHNCRIFTPANGDPAQFLPWDMDFVFTQAASGSIFPTTSGGNANLSKLLNNPAYRRLYLWHVNDLCQSVFNTTYMSPWIAHYGGVVGRDYSAALAYIQNRRASALGQLPAAVPFAITSNGGSGFAVNTNVTLLSGSGWLDVKDIEVNGIACGVTWTSPTNWSLLVPLAWGANSLTLQGVDRTGNRATNLVVSITITNTLEPTLLPVVINEWMADNAGPGGLTDPADGLFHDWFELYNPNSLPVDLGGYFLTDDFSQPTKWAIPANTVIAGHGFLLVWADEESAHNSPTNRDLHANFKLNNNGEVLGLFAPDGICPQHTIAFGPQFQNVSQGLFPDGAVGSSYFMTNWTPRSSNRLGLPPSPRITMFTVESGLMTLTFTSIPGRTYVVEYTDNLAAPLWTPLGVPRAATGETMTITEMSGLETQRFLRVRLE